MPVQLYIKNSQRAKVYHAHHFWITATDTNTLQAEQMPSGYVNLRIMQPDTLNGTGLN